MFLAEIQNLCSLEVFWMPDQVRHDDVLSIFYAANRDRKSINTPKVKQ